MYFCKTFLLRGRKKGDGMGWGSIEIPRHPILFQNSDDWDLYIQAMLVPEQFPREVFT